MIRAKTDFDCTDVIVNNESINKINRYFQINNVKDLDFKFEQLGQAHEPIFWVTAHFENCEFTAACQKKKECEKKIKTYLWKLISEETLVIDDQVKKQVKNEASKRTKYYSFMEFKSVLDKESNKDKSMLVIDVENSGEKILNDTQFKSICTTYNIGVICVCSRVVPEVDEDIIVIRRDDMHKDSADEGIRRIIYYMVDHLGFSNIGLMTRDHFGQNLKDVLTETNQKLVTFRDLEEFSTKYFRLLRDGIPKDETVDKSTPKEVNEDASQSSGVKARTDNLNE